MKKYYQSTYRIIIFLSLMLVCVSVLPTQTTTLSLKERTNITPKLYGMITLTLTLPNGDWIKATQREGRVINIKSDNSTFKLTPHITDSGNIEIETQIFPQTGIGMTDEFEFQSISKLDFLKLSRRPLSLRDAYSSFKIQVERVQYLSSIALDDDCCLSCNGVTTCACAVTMKCGSCCSGPCC